MNLRISFATTSHLNEVLQLSINAFVSAYAVYNTKEDMDRYLTENFSEDRIAQEIEAGMILIGEQDSKVVAYAKLVTPSADKIPGYRPLEISRLYTDPSLIGQGVGRQMLEAIIREAVRRKCDSVCLDVWQKNYRAINFYQRNGFRICGLTHFQLGDDIQDDFVMLRVLTK